MNEKIENPLSGATRALGICLGASTLSVAHLENASFKNPSSALIKIVNHKEYPHGGNPKAMLHRVFEEFDPDRYDRIAVTGRRFRHFVNLSSISEPEAVEYAYAHLKPPDLICPAVVSAGGETFMVYVLNKNGEVSNVLTGNKCASGTGEFFLQQLRRMGVSLEQAAQWSAHETPYAVSGRCSVFCKSDCTHAINKGIPKSRVTAGLCRMMANKVLELLKKVDRKNIMVVGGCSRNRMMIHYLQAEIDNLIVPDQAPYFEALGAALWALQHPTRRFPKTAGLLKGRSVSFDTLPCLKDYREMVTFKELERQRPEPGDVCILGLDVGSTTTKAVLMRVSDNAMLASIYLMTNGDPVGASRKCYQAIADQVKAQVDLSRISIIGLGVCGSGRQIAGLHALTDGIINEIIAHAAAAVYFDSKVDTIFEIGGQDAKYTYITAGVPSDYAMNEACSAGTGSFLEESAYETLGVKVTDIADIALEGKHPPNFNDQCAAFIASDIKTAIHEGIEQADILAGLVYSICMNYTNRVKGNRPVGEKVFMQGGVCYNRAIPMAMAALCGKPIVVPPEPGLMGAYGVALEVKKRIELGLMAQKPYDLLKLAGREVGYGKSFICRGGKEKCDRGCEISVITLDGKSYPFGGACNRYYNLRFKLDYDVSRLDRVKLREQLVFERFRPADLKNPRGKVAVNKSFLTNSFYPFYSTFFSGLGFETVYPKTASKEGIDRRNAAFCHPAELAHGFFHTLLKTIPAPDFLFLPHIRSIPVQNGQKNSQLCPFVQGEPYYLQTAFREEVCAIKKQGTRVLSPFLDMTGGFADARKSLLQTAAQMGCTRQSAAAAFQKATTRQEECLAEMRRVGAELLKTLEAEPEKTAVVIFGRPYNAMVGEAHMGIPHKLASRGVLVIPFDFLPYDQEPAKRHMYWAMGQMILKAARFVCKHPQLFAVYITNFSCGPDSFLIGYFRSIMGRKPSLTLELDSHTADAGIETRIEAFLDIVAQYRQIQAKKGVLRQKSVFLPAATFMDNGMPKVKTSNGKVLPLNDPQVTLLFPSMGRIATEAICAVFKEAGYHVALHPPADEAVLKLGRANTSCKECLPLILTTGTLLNYIKTRRRPDEIVVYFMPSASGPCRFGQYAIFLQDLIHRLEIKDTAVLSLTSDNTYFGMGKHFNYYKAWWAILISDIMEDFRSMLLADAADTDAAMAAFEAQWRLILDALEKKSLSGLMRQLDASMEQLAAIPLKRPASDVPKILLTGEIFVRRDSLSRRQLTEELAKNGFAVICSPVSEWIRYTDYMLGIDGFWRPLSTGQKIKFYIRQALMNRYEKRVIGAMARSGLATLEPVHIQTIIDHASPYLSKNLSGEAVLTVGSSLAEVGEKVCGVIAIGPFGCMPNRLSESILSEAMTADAKTALDPKDAKLKSVLAGMADLPFLAIESDGSPFPQLITAKIEAFCQRAQRLHQRMRQS